MKIVTSALVVSFFAFLSSFGEDVQNELARVKSQLETQIGLIDNISPYVAKMDLARLAVLKSASRRVLDSIEQNGLGHAQTFREYQNLIVTYRYSASFLGTIRTGASQKDLDELSGITDQIAKQFGLDDSPYTHITESVYSQIHKLIQQLQKVPLPNDLQNDLNALLAPIGSLIAVAKQGDRPKTYQAAWPVFKRIEKLDEKFDKVSYSHEAFNVILEIQGLNEYYAEVAQDFEGVKQ